MSLKSYMTEIKLDTNPGLVLACFKQSVSDGVQIKWLSSSKIGLLCLSDTYVPDLLHDNLVKILKFNY